MDGPRDVAITNQWGVRVTCADDHPAYTIDARHACQATSWGGDHTCHCVYRKEVCDGLEHLCMCGSGWSTTTPYTLCGCNHERTTMATPVGIEISAHMGEFTTSVSINADATITPVSVLAVHLQRAAKAMAVLITDGKESGHLDPDEYDGPDF